MNTVANRRDGAIRTRNKPATPGAPFQSELEKAQVGGYASLDGTSGLIPSSQLGTGTPDATTALFGDQTFKATATSAALAAETAARIAADSSEASTRASADSSEASTRAAADSAEASARAAADALLQPTSAKNQPSGYAGLDGSSKLTGSQQTYGSAANTACVGNDARLSDTRTPTDNTVSTVKLQDDAVTYAKLQNVSATLRLLGRSSAGAGDAEEITVTAAALAMLALSMVIRQDGQNLAIGGTLDLPTVNAGGGGFHGLLLVMHSLQANAAVHTIQVWHIGGRGTTVTILASVSLATGGGGESYTITVPSNGVIRLTNTSGAATFASLLFVGTTAL